MSHYALDKHQNLFQAPEGMPLPGPYYTSIVAMNELADFPFDYALYLSTDHHNGEGGIWVYFCNGTPSEANWISYDYALASGAFDYISTKPTSNPIYQDSTQGNGHTETPHANIINGKVYLTYHKNGIAKSQATILATSSNGIQFTRINGENDSVILKYNTETDPGDGHTGYFRWGKNPFSGISQQYVGYSLHGGGDDYHSAIWASDDAINWERLNILIPIEGQAIADDNLMIVWHELDPNSIRSIGNGEYTAICGVGNRASGAAARIVELYQIYLAEDGCTLTRQSERLLGIGESSAGDAEELTSPTSIEIDENMHLIYVGAANSGQCNTVISAVGAFKNDAKISKALPEGEGSRHLYT